MTTVLDSALAPVLEVPVPKRLFHLREAKWAESGNGEDYTFTGLAVPFGSWSELIWTPRGSFRERIFHGAFAEVLRSDELDCRFLINHDKNRVLGRSKAGTLELEEVESGLRVWSRVARTTYATDLKMSMERGDIDQMSFEFEMDPGKGAQERWYEDRQSGEIRHDVIKVTDLFDVSVVTFPAFTDTVAVMARDLQRAQEGGLIRSSISVSKDLPEQDLRRYARCRQAVASTAWAILPETLGLIVEILDERASGHRPSQEEIQTRIGIRRENDLTMSGSVAVIPLVGPVYSRAGAMQQTSGARSIDDFMADIRQAVNDPEVTGVVLDIDSPGGTVDGVPEAAAEIRRLANDDTPIVSVANFMAASAALWLAAAAPDGFYASPSAEVGSLGVYAAHRDISEKMRLEGQTITLVHAKDSPYKTEFSPFAPLGDEARAELERGVDAYMDMFVADMARHRDTNRTDVLANYGQGRMLTAADALEVGMIDGITKLDDVVSKLNRGTYRRSRTIRVIPVSENIEADTTDLFSSDIDFESTTHAREWLGLGAAQADPAGAVSGAPDDPAVEADTTDAAADPPVESSDPVAAFKARSAERAAQARLDRVNLTKEMLR